MLLWMGLWVYAGRQVHDIVDAAARPRRLDHLGGPVGQRRPHRRGRPGRADPARGRPAEDVADPGRRVGHDPPVGGDVDGGHRRQARPGARAGHGARAHPRSFWPCGSTSGFASCATRPSRSASSTPARTSTSSRCGPWRASRCGRWRGCPTTLQVRGADRTATSSGASPCSSCATRACARRPTRPSPSVPVHLSRAAEVGGHSRVAWSVGAGDLRDEVVGRRGPRRRRTAGTCSPERMSLTSSPAPPAPGNQTNGMPRRSA